MTATLALTDRGPILVGAPSREAANAIGAIIEEWWRTRRPLTLGGFDCDVVDLRHHSLPHAYRTPRVTRGPRRHILKRRPVTGDTYIASLRRDFVPKAQALRDQVAEAIVDLDALQPVTPEQEIPSEVSRSGAEPVAPDERAEPRVALPARTTSPDASKTARRPSRRS